MRVKRYVADSIQEAIARVKNDLGRNAIILHTKPFKEGGFLGLFSQRRVEVIAAVDEETKTVDSKKGLPPMEINESRPVEQLKSNPILKAEPAIPLAAQQTAAVAIAEPDLNSLREEIAEMKEMIRQVAIQPQPTVIKSVTTDREEGVLSELRQTLTVFGLTGELIEFLINHIPRERVERNASVKELLEYCQQLLEANLMFSEPVKPDSRRKQEIVALVGPTGVGKTTTIAKMAANFSLFEQKKVGLITIDTYRIAAVEHLKTYGDIMNLPVEVVYAPSDLQPAIESLHNCDLILIDTAGRSPHNSGMMAELHRFLTHQEISVILLVISATTQFQDMLGVEEKFSRIAYTHLVFTKLDETRSIGPIISLAWKAKRPISYLTIGQNVPDDIEVASSDKLIDQLFKGSFHG